ncbi:MAG: hypothetical protein U1F26_18155 [Lysobacterales bacterium]
MPDGDTGTNLAFTMLAVLKAARRLRGRRRGDGARQGRARGHRRRARQLRRDPGAVLQGLADGLPRSGTQSARANSRRRRWAPRARRAHLAEPREGTMLGVIADFATELRAQVEAGVADLRELFSPHEQSAPIFGEYAQPAAGFIGRGRGRRRAAGFVDFLEGVQDFTSAVVARCGWLELRDQCGHDESI